MTNNDILRRVRFILNLNDDLVLKIFRLVESEATIEDFNCWLLKDDDDHYKSCQDQVFAEFLNGLIIFKRGAREGGIPLAESKLTNNLILKKLKIAFSLQNDDIQECLSLADFKVGPHELTAFFRKPGHKHYRELKDQFLRNFLLGLQRKLRPIQVKEEDQTQQENVEKNSDSGEYFNPWAK